MDNDTLIKLFQASPGLAIAIALIFRGPQILKGIQDLIDKINEGAEKRDQQLADALKTLERTMLEVTRQINEMMARVAGGDYRIDMLQEKVVKNATIIEELQKQVYKLNARITDLEKAKSP